MACYGNFFFSYRILYFLLAHLYLHSRSVSSGKFLIISGSSSVGRARPCQGRGREFESRFPLEIENEKCGHTLTLFSFADPEHETRNPQLHMPGWWNW